MDELPAIISLKIAGVIHLETSAAEIMGDPDHAAHKALETHNIMFVPLSMITLIAEQQNGFVSKSGFDHSTETFRCLLASARDRFLKSPRSAEIEQ